MWKDYDPCMPSERPFLIPKFALLTVFLDATILTIYSVILSLNQPERKKGYFSLLVSYKILYIIEFNVLLNDI